MNDAPRRWWNILDKHSVVMVWSRHEMTDVVTCCIQRKHVSEIGTIRALHRSTALMTSHLNRARDEKEMQLLRICWIPLKEVQLQENP